MNRWPGMVEQANFGIHCPSSLRRSGCGGNFWGFTLWPAFCDHISHICHKHQVWHTWGMCDYSSCKMTIAKERFYQTMDRRHHHWNHRHRHDCNHQPIWCKLPQIHVSLPLHPPSTHLTSATDQNQNNSINYTNYRIFCFGKAPKKSLVPLLSTFWAEICQGID